MGRSRNKDRKYTVFLEGCFLSKLEQTVRVAVQRECAAFFEYLTRCS
jgi:hypothetical protein